MNTITDVLWDNLLRELRYLHLHTTNGPTLRQHLDAYIDARIAEKRTPPFKLASNEEVAEYLRAVQNAKPVPPQAPVPDGQSRAEFWQQQRGQISAGMPPSTDMSSFTTPASPTAREVHQAWKKWRAEYLYHASEYQRSHLLGCPSHPSFPELET